MHILVVDDDPLAGEMVAAVLEEAGHRTTVVENGIDALERLEIEEDIGLVLSDMNMPMVSGLELFRTLREQGNATPFILLTGDDPDALLVEEPRLDGCLTKHFDMAEALLDAIRTMAGD
jgi:CheY-like chemotaxis protein